MASSGNRSIVRVRRLVSGNMELHCDRRKPGRSNGLAVTILVALLAIAGVRNVAAQQDLPSGANTSATQATVADSAPVTPEVAEAEAPNKPADTQAPEAAPTAPLAERWATRVRNLLDDIKLGKRSVQDADVLFEELSRDLHSRRDSLRQALRWADSPGETLSLTEAESAEWVKTPVTLDDVYQSMVSLYQTRILLLQRVSPELRELANGIGQVGKANLKAEMDYMLLYLRFHSMAIPQLGPRLLEQLGSSPLSVLLELVQLMLAILLFRYWRQWAPQGLVNLRARIVQIRPRTKLSIRLARLVWYFQEIRFPLEWFLLLTFIFNIVATPELLVVEDFLQIILSGILFAWLAVRLINAIAARGIAGIADDTAGLRLRSLRLIAGWILVLSLGLKLTSTYVGEGTTYAAVWMLFEVLSIPVVILLLTWWRLEVRKELLGLPALPGWVQKATQHDGGLKGYLFTALGGLYLVFILLRQFIVRQISKFEGGREIVVMLIGRELNREYERKIQSDEITLIGQALTSELLDSKDVVAEKVYRKELRKLSEIIEFGHGGIVAVVGERGLGKSLLLRRLVAKFEGQAIIVKCSMQGFDGVKRDFAEQLQESLERLDANRFSELVAARNIRFIALDNLHYLIRPKMGGNSELERLVEFLAVMRAKLKICLIFTMVKPAYLYLKNLSAERAVQEDLVELPEWTQEQISELIETRSRMAGIEPDFSQIDIPYQYDDIDYDSREERARSGFYRVLWGVSAGNPVVAMRLWCQSLAITADGRVIVQILPQVFAGDQLENASLPVLLMLRVIVQSGLTTADDIGASLRLPDAVVENGIRFALFRGWIEELDGHYQITWQWFRAINRVLARQNLITR